MRKPGLLQAKHLAFHAGQTSLAFVPEAAASLTKAVGLHHIHTTVDMDGFTRNIGSRT